MKQLCILFVFLIVNYVDVYAIPVVADSTSGDTVSATPDSDSLMTVKDFAENRLLFLNAANFDFSGSLKVNYVGHINIFAPSFRPDGSGVFGLNSGIMKLNYADMDTSKSQLVREYIAFSPLQTSPDSGQQYTRQFSKYRYEISNTTWSFYLQPTMRLFSTKTKKVGSEIFAHLHAELLVQNWRIRTTKETIARDTATYMPGDNVHINSYSEQEINTNINRLNGYFGAGLTANVAPWEYSSFFIQGTIGVTNRDNFVGLNSNSVPPSRLLQSNDWTGFYLVRAYYSQKISNAATLVIGTDIRGYLPSFSPDHAAYVGLNLNVNEFTKLLKP